MCPAAAPAGSGRAGLRHAVRGGTMRDPTSRAGGSRDAYVSFVMMETETKTTNFDPVGPNGWSIRDEVTQFREWGTHVSYPFPPKHVGSNLCNFS